MRRVVIPVSPGRANSDSAVRRFDLGLRCPLEHFAAAAAAAPMPSPSATLLRELFGHIAQLRDDALAHGRDLHLGELEAKRPDDVVFLDCRVWLFQNSVAWL